MNSIVRRRSADRKRRIERRLDKSNCQGCDQPILTASNIHFELGARARGVNCGGIGAMHLLARRIGLIDEINSRLHVLKIHLPYFDSDHVLSLAYNVLCDGTCLEDLELRRTDEAFLDALGARRIPDPTTAGDYCRRFTEDRIEVLQDIFNRTRQKVWAEQPREFFRQAKIDMDGTLVETTGECKQGIGLSYNGKWGYHPLVVSLANTGEVLRLLNRPGNRPSHEGAAAEVDKAMTVCFQGGFEAVLLRGDTDFTQTRKLDEWDDDSRVTFIVGIDVTAQKHILADDLPGAVWKLLERPARYEVQTHPRARPPNVKQAIVEERQFKDIRLVDEYVAEIPYRPGPCRKTYRLVVVRKNLAVKKQHDGQYRLFDDYRYFMYLTNDRHSSAADIVLQANDRCDQENLLAQLKGGVKSLRAPVDTLLSNWAYMLMTSLAWNLKAWWALWLPDKPGRWAEKHREEKRKVLRMEFKTFINAFVRLPCQIIHTGRKIIYRLLGWNRWQHVFFRLTDHLRC